MVQVVSEDAFGLTHRAIGLVSGGTCSSWFRENFPELWRRVSYREKRPKGMRILEDRLAETAAPTRRDKIDAT